MTFSEFGRRAISNGSRGTDHGWASPMFVFGSEIKTRIIGKNPDLTDLVGNNIKIQNDYRQVYSSILTDWLGASDDLAKSVMFDTMFTNLPIFNKQVPDIKPISTERINVYPNPANEEIYVESGLMIQGNDKLTITDMNGRVLPLQVTYLSTTQIRIKKPNITSGKYFIRLENDKHSVVKPVMILR